MPFPTPLSSPQLATLRTSGYWSRNLVCLNPNDIVFQAQSTQTITAAPFVTFSWDNATIGAYTDAWEGMVCFISPTTDLRSATYRGRVRLAPSATHFNIDLNGTVLNDNDYITVIRDCDLFARIRNDTLVDGSIAYQPLPPMLNDHPNTVVLYDVDNDGQVAWTPVQSGIAVDADATVVDTWAWDISGDGTSAIDDPTLEHPAFTFAAGYHYLVRVIYTDDAGTSNCQLTHIYAVTRTFTAPVVSPIITGSVSGSTDDGWTCDLTAYADVATLLDRTHAAVFHVEHFGDDSSSPFFDTVLMTGRIRSDSIQTQGSAEAGQVQQVTFQVEGIAAYLRRLRIPNDIIRATDSPDEWGEINSPTPYRMAVYALWVYSTLTNIGSFGVQTGAFAAWGIGGEPRGIDGGYALEVLTNVLDPIKAAVNYAPSGELFLARTVSYEEDRSGVPLIAITGLQDITEYTVNRDSSRTYAQVIAYGGVFDSLANTFVLYTASAPSIVYGDGGDTLEITREILAANSTILEATDEIGLRVSNHYAYENSKPLLSETLLDSYAGVMIPTNYQRWVSVYPATSNTLGIAYTAVDYWQLQSVTLTLNVDGSIDVSVEKYAETSFNEAQIIADQLPNNLENLDPVLPVLPNDPAFPTDPLELYPTDTPALEDLQPIDSFSGMQAYTPTPPDVAAQIALRQGTANCKTLAVNYRWTSNVISSWVTASAHPYLLTLDGSTKIASDGWQHTSDFTVDDDGWTIGLNGQFVGGVGVQTTLYIDPITGYYQGLQVERAFTPDANLTSMVSLFTVVWGVNDSGVEGRAAFLYQTDTSVPNRIATGGYPTALTSLTYSGALTTGVIGMAITVGYDEFLPRTDPGGQCTLVRIVTTGTGINPFTGDDGSAAVYADAFYQWQLDEDGNEINVGLLAGGLYIDDVQYTPVPTIPFPPFNKSHQYANLPYTGTGNPLRARMVLSNSTAQSVYENITVCRNYEP